MRTIYVLLAGLLVFGDLLKRLMPATTALWLSYGSACALLLLLIARGRRYPRPIGVSRTWSIIYLSTWLLVAAYLLQLFSTWGSKFPNAAIHAAYLCVPLAYLLVVQGHCRHFDLTGLTQVVLIFMAPINVVGAVQYWIQPTFLVSFNYSDEGGIIARNLLTVGSFLRFPSLFASADRYSAMGLMQLYLSIRLLGAHREWPMRRALWAGFNIAAGFAALLIAGARSRILIALAMVAIMGLAYLLAHARAVTPRGRRERNPILRVMAATAAFSLLASIALRWVQPEGEDAFSVMSFLSESVENRDIDGRIGEAATVSAIPDDLTFFGEGLGTQGVAGKPGEFGMRSMWRESGLMGTLLLMSAFVSLAFALTHLGVRALLGGRPVDTVVFSTPVMLLVFGLLAGLTGVFELSSGILLGCSIGDIGRGLATRTLPASGKKRHVSLLRLHSSDATSP